MASPFCALLRTKTAYYRTPDGERIFKPDESTACYTCLKTQRPVGPTGGPSMRKCAARTADASNRNKTMSSRFRRGACYGARTVGIEVSLTSERNAIAKSRSN